MSEILSGKVALITGASSGIGRSTALALGATGVRVALVARRADRLKELAAEVEQSGGEALILPANVSDEAEATKAVEDAVKHFGRLDILVNSAGMTQGGRVEDADIAVWREVHDVNFWATLYTTKAAIPTLKAQGGDVINISSTAGRRAAGSTFGPYSTSKFALTALTEGLRQEVGGSGIRVCIIEPGATNTGIAENIRDPQLRAGIGKHISKEGAMQPEDIADAILFVVSLPPRVNVSQLLIRPTIDVAPM